MASVSPVRGGGKGAGKPRSGRPPVRSGRSDGGVAVFAVDMGPSVQITDQTHIACLSVAIRISPDDKSATLVQVPLTPIQLARMMNQCAGAMLSQVHTGATILTKTAPKPGPVLVSVKPEPMGAMAPVIDEE